MSVSIFEKSKSNRLGYLASPYSHPNKKIKEARFQVVNQLLIQLFQEGRFLYSPLTHNVTLDNLGLSGGWELWGEFDCMLLSRCDYILVLKQDGWETSTGLRAEIELATHLNMDIEYIDVPQTIKYDFPDLFCLENT